MYTIFHRKQLGRKCLIQSPVAPVPQEKRFALLLPRDDRSKFDSKWVQSFFGATLAVFLNDDDIAEPEIDVTAGQVPFFFTKPTKLLGLSILYPLVKVRVSF